MFYRFMRALVYPFIKIIFRIRVNGMENIPSDGGFVLCANHVSMADALILGITFKRTIHFMSKEELFKTKITKWFFNALGCIAVKRGKGDVEAIGKACEYIEKGEIFGIFPEGTRHYGERPSKPKAGAAVVASKTGAMVLPVSIKYSTVRAKAFCRVNLHIGKLISIQKPDGEEESERAKIRRVSESIMDNIISLWEETV